MSITTLLLPNHIKTEPFTSYIPFHGLIASKKTLYTYTAGIKVLVQLPITVSGPMVKLHG